MRWYRQTQCTLTRQPAWPVTNSPARAAPFYVRIRNLVHTTRTRRCTTQGYSCGRTSQKRLETNLQECLPVTLALGARILKSLLLRLHLLKTQNRHQSQPHSHRRHAASTKATLHLRSYRTVNFQKVRLTNPHRSVQPTLANSHGRMCGLDWIS